MHSLDTTLKYISSNWFDLIVILIIAWVARYFGAKLIHQIIRRAVRRTRFNDMSDDDVKKRQDTLIGLIDMIWKIFVVAVAGMMIFKQLFKTVDLGPLFASAGIVGVAIGFGAQSIIKDFLTGIFILSENQYRVGDIVDLDNGATGTVERVGIRSTILRDADGNVHYIPNGNVAHVINKTMGFSKVNFTLAVNPDTDIDKLTKVINTTSDKMSKEEGWSEKVIDPPHFLNIGTFSELGMEVTIMGKTQPSAQWSVTGELRRRLIIAFQKHQIELAQSPTMPWQTKKK